MTLEQVDLRRFPGEEQIKADEIIKRGQYLVSLGFTPAWVSTLQESRPTLFAPVVVEAHLMGLRERGFGNPNKMVESSPAILGLAFENIDAKLAGLRERGFGNPNKMVESSPAILGLAFENIDRRIRLFSKLNHLYELSFKPTELMEQESALFSSKLDKLLTLTRVLWEYQVTPPELDEKVISRIVRLNLEDLLVALSMEHPQDEAILDLVNRAIKVKREKLPKDEKRGVIAKSKVHDKIKGRYFRGYPEK